MSGDVIAIIPARGGSKRFPRKNIADLRGQPLLSYSIAAAQQAGIFERIVVSSEDEEIKAIAREYGAESFSRSSEFATDTAHELDACMELIEAQEKALGDAPSLFCVIYPTAVLLTGDDLRGSYEKMKERTDCGALMSVSGFNYHPYKSLVEDDEGCLKMLFPVECKERSQTYPHLTASNGTFYWLRTEIFRKNRDRGYYQERLLAYEIEAERAVDVDYPEDLKKIEHYLKVKEDL